MDIWIYGEKYSDKKRNANNINYELQSIAEKGIK